MRRCNRKIGFDDRLVMLISIPVLSFIVPIVFMGCRFDREPLFSWDKYVTTLVIITVVWIGNRQIMIHSRKKYRLFEEVRMRIIFQSVLMLVFTIVSNNVLGFLAHDIFFEAGSVEFVSDHLISSNAASIFCTIMIIAIYESIYFMNELRSSVEETENLKRENLTAQLNALRTQVNPHFLFNNLNTLSSIIPEDPQQAVDFVQQLSKVYRHILQVKDEKSIPLKEELDVLRAYAFLLKTRFGQNLEIDIDVAEEKMQKRIVPLSLQLLMENAIKHNIVSADKPLKIDVYAENGSLVVSNNLQKKNQLHESTGIGLDNIRNRYKLLSDKIVQVTEYGNNFTVSIPLLAG
ncbi:MAG: histidine kinase [Gloeobacteraceae cyanobacterium ES-bin-316]|nr:histidine kinase [Ferruginibacter sp.]